MIRNEGLEFAMILTPSHHEGAAQRAEDSRIACCLIKALRVGAHQRWQNFAQKDSKIVNKVIEGEILCQMGGLLW